MNRSFDRALARRCLPFLMAAACAVQIVTAQDAAPPLPPLPAAAANGDVLIERHCVGQDADGCTRETIVVTRRLMARPGEIIDVRGVRSAERQLKAIFVAPPCPEECQVETVARFVGAGCPCAAAGECACGSTSCGSDCAAAAACKCCACAAEKAAAECIAAGAKHAQLHLGLQCGSDCAESKCGEEASHGPKFFIRHVQHADESDDLNPVKLLQHIAGLVGEKAAAVAALEVRKQADEQIGELYEAMSELLADNAAMDAKLEAAAEQRALLEKVAELAAENARLKTHLELAAERAEVHRQSAALALENERLKLHIAAIEQKHTLAEAIRAAAKPKDHEVR